MQNNIEGIVNVNSVNVLSGINGPPETYRLESQASLLSVCLEINLPTEQSCDSITICIVSLMTKLKLSNIKESLQPFAECSIMFKPQRLAP